MFKMNDLSHVLGRKSLKDARPMLMDFWHKYRALYPRHELWKHVDNGHKDLGACLPLYLHGDEGVSFKKGGIFIFSFQGAIGYGSSKRSVLESEKHYRASGEGIRINFLNTGLQTRMMICNCPKECVDSTC